MSIADGAPGSEFTEVIKTLQVRQASSNIGAFIGPTEMGPPDVSVLCRNWADYKATFGAYGGGSGNTPYAAKRAFDGGSWAYVIRVTAHDNNGVTLATKGTQTLQTIGGGATAGQVVGSVVGLLWQVGGLALRTWDFQPGYKLGIAIDGGAIVDVTITAAPATKATSAGGPTWNVSHGQTILYRVGPANSPIRTLPIPTLGADGAATQDEVTEFLGTMFGVSAAKNGATVVMTTDQLGTGARLEFTGGTALGGLGLATQVLVGTGVVADVDHVTSAELTTLVAAVAGAAFSVDTGGHPVLANTTTGSGHSIQIDTSTNARAAGAAVLGVDANLHAGTSNSPLNTLRIDAATPGTFSQFVTVDTGPASFNASTRGKLIVYLKGILVDTIDEYTLDPSDPRYLLKLLAASVASNVIAITDMNAFGTTNSYVTALPATGAAQPLSTGNDGLAGIADADYIGDATLHTGIHALDAIRDVSYAGCPGNTSRLVFAAGYAWAAARKNVVWVGDMPSSAGLALTSKKDWRMGTGAYAGQGAAFDTTYGAVYGPWFNVTDQVTKLPRAIPPMGDVFAAFANANIRGTKTAWGVPAGEGGGVLQPGALSLVENLSDGDVGYLYQLGMNSIINHPDFGFVIWGQKTLPSLPSDLDRLEVRRGFIFVRQSLKPTFDALVFQKNDPKTWRASEDQVVPFLRKQVAVGGLEANGFRFVNDSSTNTPDLIQAHIMNPQLFLLPTKAAEYIKVDMIDVPEGTNLTGP